jgi:hypothetical protein
MSCRVIALPALLIALLVSSFAAMGHAAVLTDRDARWRGEYQQTPSPRPAAPSHHCLVPGPQPATNLHQQPFAYGYFGSHAPTTVSYHRNYRGDSYQWMFYRAD